METTPPDRESSLEWTVVSIKRRVEQPVKEPKVVSMDSRGNDPCWKFVVELGDYRIEPEILAELHLSDPYVKLDRRNGVSSNAHLTAKDERSRALLEGLRTLNGKTCAFLPLESETRRTFIRMHHGKTLSTRRASTGCITHDALGPSRQAGYSHRYGEGCALREATPGKVHYFSFLVACLVTPAIWLNLSDSRNILIMHFGLLLKERTLDSIGHDLWKQI